MPRHDETEMGGPRGAFQPTLWTQVLLARDRDAPEGRDALERLVGLYWRPVYFHVRRLGKDVETAKDLTQEFFARVMERGTLADADPTKGRFRTFLLTVLDRFLCDEHRRERAKRRRPDFDFTSAEAHFRLDQTFERDWAMAVLERGFVRLAARSPHASVLARALRKEAVPYAQLARELETTESNVKVMVHRARRELREILLEELRATVDRPGEEAAELAELFGAFSV
ncbi:MAG: sigma-70 family RNA polymerase sigma factor [Planctomycetes bacterium]|nr:sigma-70 family RNA polymerase sigma factor [Planctomycetota bacterium]